MRTSTSIASCWRWSISRPRLRSALLGLAAVVALTACDLHIGPAEIVQGSGNVKTESRQVQGFDKVELNGVGTLTITQGSTEALTVQAEDNLLPRLRSDVSGGTLRLGPQGVAIGPTKPVRYDLSVKQLSGIALTGAADVDAANLQADQLALKTTGSGNLNVGRLTASSLTVDVTGSGTVTVSGQVPRQMVTISGAGRYRAASLASQQATVQVTGAADCAVRVSDHLMVTISGAGHVSYAGSPTVDERVTGAGQITRTGD
jgi:Putative auto-transporter adhesin, head GIN domain